MENLIKPNFIALDETTFKGGLYESYYFRGNSGIYSFWLKHNFLRFKKSNEVRIDNILIVFNNESGKSEFYEQSKTFAISEFLELAKSVNGEWNNLTVKFNNDNFFSLSNSKLSGKMDNGITWDFDLKLSGETYFHFDKKWFYFGFFPKKKILTKDIKVTFKGKIESPLVKTTGEFLGMNGHNWGKEHAYLYAYADCNQFLENGKVCDGAYFDGFSVKILLGPVVSPYLSCCSLKYKNEWFHFNNVLDSYKHQVKTLSLKKWEATFVSSGYELEIMIDGETTNWVSLIYDHPTKKQSTVNNSKNAKATLSLFRKDGSSKELITKLETVSFELETLIP